MWNSFTQSSGTLTIMNASAKQGGGVVDLGAPQGRIWRCCLRMLHGLFSKVSRVMFDGVDGLSALDIAACRSWYSNSHQSPREFE